jgi:hypothetical protein
MDKSFLKKQGDGFIASLTNFKCYDLKFGFRGKAIKRSDDSVIFGNE